MLCPPTTKTLPSGSSARPAQKRSPASNGTVLNVFAIGSHTCTPFPPELLVLLLLVSESHTKTFPVGITAPWIDTSGQFITADHCPTWDGGGGLFAAPLKATICMTHPPELLRGAVAL